jgi:hypothetical protein
MHSKGSKLSMSRCSSKRSRGGMPGDATAENLIARRSTASATRLGFLVHSFAIAVNAKTMKPTALRLLQLHKLCSLYKSHTIYNRKHRMKWKCEHSKRSVSILNGLILIIQTCNKIVMLYKMIQFSKTQTMKIKFSQENNSTNLKAKHSNVKKFWLYQEIYR